MDRQERPPRVDYLDAGGVTDPALKAWAFARSRYDGSAEAQKDPLDRLIVWRMNDPRCTDRTNRVKGIKMQRQWTIEVRADFSDKEKNDAIDKIIKEAAVYVHANAALIADVQKPEVVCYSDDFFHGREELDLHNDKIGKAIVAHGESIGGGSVSDELVQAATEMLHDK
jgi:hypothetical protein